MRYIEKVEKLIGNTPMYKLNNEDYGIPENVNIFAKMEYVNPGGGIKDRTVLYMIEKAERDGLIKPGDTILEATAGNTGIARAFLGKQKGYNVIIAVPGKFSIEKQILMRALGATVYKTSTKGGMDEAYATLEEAAKEIEGNTFVLNQFSSQTNPDAHYYMTGPEIYEDLDGNIDAFIAGAGTGGAYCGIVRYLKEQNPQIKGILAEPEGSIYGGGEYHSYRIEGVGNDFIPETMDLKYMDEALYVNDDEAYSMVRTLAENSALLVASSSGANVAAAIKYAKGLETDKQINIVTMLPDRSERYFSKDIYGYDHLYDVSFKLRGDDEE